MTMTDAVGCDEGLASGGFLPAISAACSVGVDPDGKPRLGGNGCCSVHQLCVNKRSLAAAL